MEMKRKSVTFIPFIVSLVGALILVAAFFLPTFSSTAERRESLEDFADEIDYDFEAAGMTYRDTMDISLFEFLKVYMAEAKEDGGDEATVVVAVFAAIEILALLVLLFAALKKAIPLLIFNCLTFGVFRLLIFGFEMDDNIARFGYNWGISYYLYHIAPAIIVVGSIWLLVAKIIEKKQKKAAQIAA